jgi:hypothetical protein
MSKKFGDELIEKAQQEDAAKLVDENKKAIVEILATEEGKSTLETIKFHVKKETVGKLPRTPEDVYQYVKKVYGYDIPWTACSPEMNAPFEWFYEVFTGKVRKSVAQGSRGSGKTLLGSVMHHMWCSTTPGAETRHAAASKQQSSVAQGYLRVWDRDPVLSSLLVKGGLNKESATWINGSYWKIVTGSMAGVCLSGDTQIITNIGALPIHEIVDNKLQVRVLSANPATHLLEWKDVIGWHNNGRENEWWRVRLQYCLNSKVKQSKFTKNHQIMLRDGSKKQLCDLLPGDRVAQKCYRYSEDEKQVLLGSLLGDSTVDKSFRYCFVHGNEQKYYGDWKYAALVDDTHQGKVTKCKGGFGTECNYYRLRKTLYTQKLRPLCYPNDTKKVTREWLDQLNELGVATWLMDDGSFSSGRNWDIYTNGFTLEEQHVVADFFKDRLGITANIRTDKRNGVRYYISFTAEDSKILTKYVERYLVVKDKKKIWLCVPIIKGAPGVCSNPVLKIQRATTEHVNGRKGKNFMEPTNRIKYDITVADFHNYVTVDGLNVSNSGSHPMAVTWDELEFWDTAAIEQTWAVPINVNPNIPGIWAGFSTMQRAYGAMAYLVNAIETKEKEDIKLYKWCMFETMKRCETCVAIDENPHGDDESRQKSCVLWEDCHGQRGIKSSGWIPREDVCSLKNSMSLTSWQTQGLCLRPSSQGVVLHNFTHEYKPKGNYSKWVFDYDNPVWYACIDPAEGKKCVIYFIQLDQYGNRYVFDELNIEQCADASQAKLAFYARCMEKRYGDPEVMVFDPRRTDAMATFAHGSKFGSGLNKSYKVDKPDMAENKGGQEIVVTIEFLRASIRNGAGEMSLFVNPETCPKLVIAIKQHHYRTKKNSTEIVGNIPAEAYKDEIDPLRYFEQWFKYKFGSNNVSIRIL